MKIIQQLLRWANILLVLVTLLAYLSPTINPAKVWHFSFLGLAYPVLLAGNVFFIAYWLLKRRLYFFYSLACIVVGFGYFTSFFGFNFFKSAQKKAGDITVMTYNVGGYSSVKGNNKDRKAAFDTTFDKVVKKYGLPEILCIQEGKPKWMAVLLQENFGFKQHHQFKGTNIFSKYPILKKGNLPFDSDSNSCIWADIKTPKGTVRVYSTHLQSNSLTQTATKIATDGDLRQKQTWRDIRFVMRQYKRAVAIRARQADMVKKHMAESPYPVILCGDLNDPPVSYVYRQLSEGMKDGFREKGCGISSTFNGKLPALRIDHILTDPKIQIHDYRVPELELSDHFPVLVRLTW